MKTLGSKPQSALAVSNRSLRISEFDGHGLHSQSAGNEATGILFSPSSTVKQHKITEILAGVIRMAPELLIQQKLDKVRIFSPKQIEITGPIFSAAKSSSYTWDTMISRAWSYRMTSNHGDIFPSASLPKPDDIHCWRLRRAVSRSIPCSHQDQG